MKKIHLASIMFTIIAASGAYAGPTVDHNVSVSGDVPDACFADANLNLDLNIDGQLTDDMGVPVNTPHTLPIGTFTCNYAAYVGLKTQKGSLKIGNSSCDFNSPFHNCVKYDASVSWGNQSPAIKAYGDSSIDAKQSKQTSGATAGALTLSVIPVNSGSPIISGLGYSDIITVQVGAAI
jgi:hypothetical protein